MHLHIDCQFGIAGDMLLASLIDAGADVETVRGVLNAIPVDGFLLECSRTTRGGIAAMVADVTDLSGAKRKGGHTHDHSHKHGHDHGHDHDHEH